MRSPWKWRTDTSGAAVGGSTSMLRKFEQAANIREMFFRGGSQDPAIRFSATADALDQGAESFTLEVDGNTAVYRHTPPRTVPMTWPGPKPGAAVATFREKSGSQPHVERAGAWAWFKLMDTAERRREADDRYRLVFQQAGHSAEVLIEAGTARNPFAGNMWQQFSCE
jgi:type VI secretion system protein ImpL